MVIKINKLTCIIAIFSVCSCHPKLKSYVHNKSNESIYIVRNSKENIIYENSKVLLDDVLYDEESLLKSSSNVVNIGEKIKIVNRSKEYQDYSINEIGEPHYLMLEINQNGMLYLGYVTANNGKENIYGTQPRGFPAKWK